VHPEAHELILMECLLLCSLVKEMCFFVLRSSLIGGIHSCSIVVSLFEKNNVGIYFF
jgi:hypothetical protein